MFGVVGVLVIAVLMLAAPTPAVAASVPIAGGSACISINDCVK